MHQASKYLDELFLILVAIFADDVVGPFGLWLLVLIAGLIVTLYAFLGRLPLSANPITGPRQAAIAVAGLGLVLLGGFLGLADASTGAASAKEDASTAPQVGDRDGDGLDAFLELLYRTDPYDADSDGDGYVDGWEIDAGSDPLDRWSSP